MQCIAVPIALSGDCGVQMAKVRLSPMRAIAARESAYMLVKSWWRLYLPMISDGTCVQFVILYWYIYLFSEPEYGKA